MKQILPLDKIRRKLNGYRCTHRNRWLLVADNVLSLQALSLLEFYIDISDFDIKHDSFGTFTSDYVTVSKIFNCSTSTIRLWHRQLLVRGFVMPTTERNLFEIVNLQRYMSPGFWKGKASDHSKVEKNQSVENIVQLMKQNVSSDSDKTDGSPRLAVPIAIVSSKNESSNLFGMSKDDAEWIEKQFLRSSKNV